MARFCEACKQPIEAERLDLATHLCKVHAELMEAKYGGEFLSMATTQDNRKAGSLKGQGESIQAITHKRNVQGLNRLLDDLDREKWEKKPQAGG